MTSHEWNARRILKELCTAERRKEILTLFWTDAEKDTRELVTAALAKGLNFRLDSVRKATAARRAELLGMQLHVPQFEEPLEIALMLYHTEKASDLLAAFLDAWKIPHVNGSIEVEEYPVPDADAVARAVQKLKSTYAEPDIALYLATAGLLMGRETPAWRDAAWPEVDRLRGVNTSH
ncbi:MAG TPA: hypothetical protein VF720_14265 [Candidatus Eisenbacteria bacterium]